MAANCNSFAGNSTYFIQTFAAGWNVVDWLNRTIERPFHLPEIACQPGDVTADPPFTIAQTHTAVPPNTPREGFREVHFQQGNVVVSIWGDSGGWGVDEWAVAVNGRLQEGN